MYTLARYPKGPMDRHELKRVLYAWPEIMATVTDPWSLNFSANVWELYSDPKWLPTLKQSHFIRTLYPEHTEDDDEPELVEK
jgi:hypothetical protein